MNYELACFEWRDEWLSEGFDFPLENRMPKGGKMSQKGWEPPKNSRSAKGVVLLLQVPGFGCIVIPIIILLVIAVITFILQSMNPSPGPISDRPDIPTNIKLPTSISPSEGSPVDNPLTTIEAHVGEPTRVLIINPNSTPTPQGGAIVEKLTFRVFLEGCRMAPTADKPGNRKVGLNVDPTGGTPPFRYQLEDQAPQDSDVLNRDWEQGTRLVGHITVWSSDGQQVTSDFDMDVTRIQCEPATP